jgi:murein L,D-transpeptidase YafK
MRKKLIIIILSSIIVIGSVLYFTGLIFAPAVPAKEADIMEKTIAFARKQDAARFAPKEFSDCLALRSRALKEWKTQNDLWIIWRDYTKAVTLMKKSAEKADAAGKKAIEKSGSMIQFITDTENNLLERDGYFNEKFRVLPLEREILKEYSKAHLILKEAVKASSRGDIASAYQKLVIAEESFSDLEVVVRKKLNDYFKSYASWEKWYNQTVQKSKENQSYAIIVDKMAHECMLLKDGKVIDRFEAELSLNWLGRKRQQGDRVTPEGIYSITKKKNEKETKYYKALLLNYPNENDVARFEREIQSGSLSRSAHIGTLIEIHGDGGKGKDWTEGCVALTNSDIEKLYATVNTGTPVTIVGSLTPLNKLFD